MKVVFLDIDGVLNNTATFHRSHELWTAARRLQGPGYTAAEAMTMSEAGVSWPVEHAEENPHWEDDLVENFRTILDATGALVVISSSWRRHMRDPQLWVDVFKRWHDLDMVVLGITSLEHTSHLNMRGDRIQLWLDKNPEVTNYVILDDSYDMLGSQLPNFVRTNMDLGLTKGDAQMAINILNGQLNWKNDARV